MSSSASAMFCLIIENPCFRNEIAVCIYCFTDETLLRENYLKASEEVFFLSFYLDQITQRYASWDLSLLISCKKKNSTAFAASVKMNLTNVCQIWKQELKMQKSRLESDSKERLIKLPLAVFFIFFARCFWLCAPNELNAQRRLYVNQSANKLSEKVE